MSIQDNIENTRAKIKDAALTANRDPQGITLLAVSKGQNAQQIREARVAGLRHFGENYWQEAHTKMQALEDIQDITWYFIGHIQSNKTQMLAKHFDWVLSVHNEKTARLLAQHRNANQCPLNVCIAVNLDEEPDKSGAKEQAVLPLAHIIMNLPSLKLRGLMAIPKQEADTSLQLASFNRLAVLFNQLNNELPYALDTLSIGMSDDFQAAICAGSTMIRIGRAIFGSRRRSIPR